VKKVLQPGCYFVGEYMGSESTKNPDFVTLKIYDNQKVHKLVCPVDKLNGEKRGDKVAVRVNQSIRRKVDESTGRERVDVSFFVVAVEGIGNNA
jgi:hypothetical protein